MTLMLINIIKETQIPDLFVNPYVYSIYGVLVVLNWCVIYMSLSCLKTKKISSLGPFLDPQATKPQILPVESTYSNYKHLDYQNMTIEELNKSLEELAQVIRKENEMFILCRDNPFPESEENECIIRRKVEFQELIEDIAFLRYKIDCQKCKLLYTGQDLDECIFLAFLDNLYIPPG